MTQNGFWKPPKMWKGQTAFIIGGGPSLKGMDWTPLHSKHIIGCNDAYTLGPWVDVCYFGDDGWYFKHHKTALLDFPGLKVCSDGGCLREPGILVVKRTPRGFHTDKIGWNVNTGASAINLAYLFGVSRVVLLGFDMQLGAEGESNWHPNAKDKPNPKNYLKFLMWFEFLKKGLDEKAPELEVLNATPNSKLDLFPRVKLEDVL